MTAVVLALLEGNGRLFVQRRDPEASVMPGRWEFPGGKVEAGETLTAALARELREELGVALAGAEALEEVDGEPTLHPFRVRILGSPRTQLAWGWFTVEELRHLPIPPRNRQILGRIPFGTVPGDSP